MMQIPPGTVVQDANYIVAMLDGHQFFLVKLLMH